MNIHSNFVCFLRKLSGLNISQFGRLRNKWSRCGKHIVYCGFHMVDYQCTLPQWTARDGRNFITLMLQMMTSHSGLNYLSKTLNPNNIKREKNFIKIWTGCRKHLIFLASDHLNFYCLIWKYLMEYFKNNLILLSLLVLVEVKNVWCSYNFLVLTRTCFLEMMMCWYLHPWQK